MRFNKVKKVIAIILTISIVMGIAAVCTGLFAGAAKDNMLNNASFEEAKPMGYTDKLIGIGQYNALATDWYGSNARGTRTAIDHTSDSKDGSYSIKFKIPSDAMTVTLRPRSTGLDQSNLTADGKYYKFSAWVKGTNANSYLEVETTDGKVYRQAIPAGQTWHKVELDNIFLSKTIKIVSKNYTDVNGSYELSEARIIVAKDTAEYVTTHIHEDGILNALKHYNLI